MTHIKYGDTYLVYYLGRQKTTRKWFKIFTLVFSTGGVLGWTIWDYVPIIACGLIALMQLVTVIENQIVPSDKDVDNVAELRNKYIFYFNKLEKLWVEFGSNILTEQQATEQFYNLRQIGADIEAIDNKLHIRKIKKLCDKADTETRNYLIQYHS